MKSESALGVLYAGGAFLVWGVVPIYWKHVQEVPPLELLAHRVFWALPLLLAYVVVRRRSATLVAAVADRRTLGVLVVSMLLVSMNWLTFIFAVATERVLQASLGYYINPLVSVLLGMVFLGERLSRSQWVAIVLALAGVTVLTVDYGRLPWIALVLAISFGLYGLLRKTVRADAVTGLTIEVAILSPLALAYLLWTGHTGTNVFASAPLPLALLVLCAGPITVLPLVWFTNGARRIRLSTVGILQYLAPTGQFILAVLVFHEPFTAAKLAAFALIWTGLVIYSLDAHAQHRRRVAIS